jgi:tetratricopeptide (TPR) repeat protein
MSEIESSEEEALASLEGQFLHALRLKDQGRVDDAEDKLRHILKTEPRLAEPHMELGRLLLDTNRVRDAESHAREALQYLEAGGQWTDEIPEHVLLAVAHGLLAEVLRRMADEDDIIFGSPERFRELVAESQQHFTEAARLDSSDEYSSYHAFFLGMGDTATPMPDA